MKILLNKYNYIIAYCTAGEIKDALEIELQEDFKIEEHNLLDYQYISEKLVYNPIPKKPEGVKLEYDGKKWIETATVQEQLEYYKQKIIECTKEIYIEERAGFKPSDELLQKKEHYSNLHMQISQPEAIKINKHMDSTKPGTAQVQ